MQASSLDCGREVRLAVGLLTAPASHRFADLESEWVERSAAPADATLFERVAVGPAA